VLLTLSGTTVPPLVPVLVLGAIVALSVNRGAFFTTELAFTADAAVLLAAVVGFRSSAPVWGPCVVAALMGPLDALHWRARAFPRMAYNTGSQVLAVVPAALVYGALRDALGGTVVAASAVAVAAAVGYALLDSLFATVLVVLRGDAPPLRAPVVVASMNRWAVPFALAGACAGVLVSAVGWWAAPLVLVPVCLAPELAVGHVRPTTPTVRGLVAGAVAVLGFVGAVALGGSGVGTAWGLGVLVVLAGVELRSTGAAPVAPLLSTVVVVSLVVAGSARDVAAVVVAVSAALVGWFARRVTGRAGRRERELASPWRAVLVAAAAAAAAAALFESVPAVAGVSGRAMVVALGSGLVFEAVVAASARGWSDVVAAQATWTLPILALAVVLAMVERELGGAVALVVGGGLGACLLVTAWWAAPPWTSGVLGAVALSRRAPRVGRRVVLVGTAGAAVVTAVLARGVSGSARVVCVLMASAFVQCAVSMALVGVRQWRFAPRPRAWDATLLVLVAAGGLAYAAAALGGATWAIVLVTVLVAVPGAVAWPIAALADRARAGAPDRAQVLGEPIGISVESCDTAVDDGID
jgi:hypothetical protein